MVKPVTDEQVFYDKFLCDKFYLLVCTRNFDKFFYDKCTCSKASMLANKTHNLANKTYLANKTCHIKTCHIKTCHRKLARL
jgi:hypothetical protein